MTGNYPSDWVTDELLAAINSTKGRTVVLIDTLRTSLSDRADVVIPGATWMEKAGTFESVSGRLQAFERAIEPIDYCKGEAQIALDLAAARSGDTPAIYNPVSTRRLMAEVHGLKEFVSEVHRPSVPQKVEADMQLVEL